MTINITDELMKSLIDKEVLYSDYRMQKVTGVLKTHNGWWFTCINYGLPEGTNVQWHPAEGIKDIR